MSRSLIICLLLTVATLAVYGQALTFEFVEYDDDIYVTQNAHIHKGLTLSGLRWVFTSEHGGNWHPLTGLSHMLDCELFQLNPAGHHLISVILHLLNTLLMFGVLRSMTRAIWPSAFVAAMFGLHPLHVESVAWISERKDVLSTCFSLLAIWAYLGYTRRPGAGRYALTAILMAIGLMAKPMLVTLPLLLLLLDYWPLGRIHTGQAPDSNVSQETPRNGPIVSGRPITFLLIEKIPLLTLSVISCVITVMFQQSAGAVSAKDVIPMKLRVANSLVSSVRYLDKTLWPTNLSVLYPHPNLPGGTAWSSWQVAGAGLLLLAMTIVAVRRRYAIVGWLWYLGMLVPVIGLVQVGSQAMADRYTYMPIIGLFVIVAWCGADLASRFGLRHPLIRPAVGAVAIFMVVAAMVCSRSQARYWHDSIALLEHAIEAAPGSPDVHYNLAISYRKQENLDDALDHYRKVLDIDPHYAEAHNNLGLLLEGQGEVELAIGHYREAARLKDRDARSRFNLGNALLAVKQVGEALTHLNAAIRLDPNWPDPLNRVAWLRATHTDSQIRVPSEALRLAQRAAALTDHQDTWVLDTLATAYASANQFDMALSTAREALTLAVRAEDRELAQNIRDRMELYAQQIPYREGER